MERKEGKREGEKAGHLVISLVDRAGYDVKVLRGGSPARIEAAAAFAHGAVVAGLCVDILQRA